MQYLLFTTITDSGISNDIELPLHPETNSIEAISDLTTRLLEIIIKSVYEFEGLKYGDILQALAMVSAIGRRMIGIVPAITKQIFDNISKQNHAAILAAKQNIS